MKKILLSTLLVLGLSLPLTVSSSNALNARAENETYYLVLGQNGLYNGEKGQTFEQLYLENTVSLELAIGDALPTKEEITSSIKDVTFTSWAVYEDGGALNFYTSAPSEARILYAMYDYTGSGEDVGGGESGDTFTIYFQDTEWWNNEAPATGIYLWNDDGNRVAWPGERMTHVKYDETEKYNIWSFEVPVEYDNVIFTRVSPEGAISDYGAKTIDLSLLDRGENNMYSILGTEAVWGDPGVEGYWTTYEE